MGTFKSECILPLSSSEMVSVLDEVCEFVGTIADWSVERKGSMNAKFKLPRDGFMIPPAIVEVACESSSDTTVKVKFVAKPPNSFGFNLNLQTRANQVAGLFSQALKKRTKPKESGIVDRGPSKGQAEYSPVNTKSRLSIHYYEVCPGCLKPNDWILNEQNNRNTGFARSSTDTPFIETIYFLECANCAYRMAIIAPEMGDAGVHYRPSKDCKYGV
jgi:hypothetical protein